MRTKEDLLEQFLFKAWREIKEGCENEDSDLYELLGEKGYHLGDDFQSSLLFMEDLKSKPNADRYPDLAVLPNLRGQTPGRENFEINDLSVWLVPKPLQMPLLRKEFISYKGEIYLSFNALNKSERVVRKTVEKQWSKGKYDVFGKLDITDRRVRTHICKYYPSYAWPWQPSAHGKAPRYEGSRIVRSPIPTPGPNFNFKMPETFKAIDEPDCQFYRLMKEYDEARSEK